MGHGEAWAGPWEGRGVVPRGVGWARGVWAGPKGRGLGPRGVGLVQGGVGWARDPGGRGLGLRGRGLGYGGAHGAWVAGWVGPEGAWANINARGEGYIRGAWAGLGGRVPS